MEHTKDLKHLKIILNEYSSVNSSSLVLMLEINLIGYMVEKKQTIIEYSYMNVLLPSKNLIIVIVKNFEI